VIITVYVRRQCIDCIENSSNFFKDSVYDSELTMGHGTNGSTDLDWSRGPWDPLTDD